MPETKPHIILITYYFPPMSAIGGVRPFRFYKYLKQLGYTCDVVTAAEQTQGASSDIRVVPDSTASVWSGEQAAPPYSLTIAAERLLRRFVVPGHTGIAWSRAVSTECRRLAAQNRHRKTVLLSTCPPTGAQFAALQVAYSSPLPWIADFRDPLTLGPGLERRSPITRLVVSQTEARTFQRASAVIANVESAALLWRDLYPFAKDKLHVIWNGFDPDEQPKARPVANSGPRVILHAGAIYGGRNANAIVYTMTKLREKGALPDVSLKLIGPIGAEADIDEPAHARASQEGWLEMNRKSVPRQQAQQMTESADGLLLLQPQSTVQVPGKLFEYICIGRPILALVPRESAVEWILSQAGVPYVCIYPDDAPESADQKMLHYLSLPSTPVTSSAWFQESFNVERQTRHLAAIIDSLV